MKVKEFVQRTTEPMRLYADNGSSSFSVWGEYTKEDGYIQKCRVHVGGETILSYDAQLLATKLIEIVGWLYSQVSSE